MNPQKRKIIFLLFAIIFLVVAPVVLFYSQGYRFNWQNFRLVQTGALYFQVIPREVNITVFSKEKNKVVAQTRTSFFFGTAYIANLIPGNYHLTVSQEGYHSWQKELLVEEKRITEIKNITLLPVNPSFSLIEEEVLNFFPLSNQNRVALVKEREKEWEVLIYDQNFREPFVISEKKIAPNSSLINILSFPNTRDIIIDIGTVYLVVNPEDNTLLLTLKEVTNPVLNNNTVFYKKNGALVSFNYQTKTLLTLAEKIKTFAIRSDGTLFWLSQEGFLFKNGQIVQNSLLSLNEKKESEILFPNSLTIAVRKDDSFFFLKDAGFKKLFNSPRHLITSPNLKKLINSNEYEIRILFLEEEDDQPRRKRGDNIFLTRFSEEIGEIYWLTSHYLIFNIENNLKVMEIDNRDNLNIINLASFENPKIYFHHPSNRLYLLTNEIFFVSERLLP